MRCSLLLLASLSLSVDPPPCLALPCPVPAPQLTIEVLASCMLPVGPWQFIARRRSFLVLSSQRLIHAGRETEKLADKDLGAAPKSNSVLEFPAITVLFGEFSRKSTHILNTTEFQYWDVEDSESHRNPVAAISFSDRSFVGKLIHSIISQNPTPTLSASGGPRGWMIG